VNLITAPWLRSQRFPRALALVAVLSLVSAPLASSGSRVGSSAAQRAGFYGITRHSSDRRVIEVPATQGPTGGSSDPCPAGMSLLSGGVVLGQDKYAGSLLGSFPEKDAQGREHWGAIVVNPGLGLGEPGELGLRVVCFRPINAYQPHPAQLGPVTSVDVIPKEMSGYVGEQDIMSRRTLCHKPINANNTVGQLLMVGGGFSLDHTSSAAPYSSDIVISEGDLVGWVAGASNLGIGETPGVLNVTAYCLALQHGHGTPDERLFTRVVGPVHYKLPPGPSVDQHSADCPGLPNEKSWAISGGFSIGYDLAWALPHVTASEASARGDSWSVSAVNPPGAPEVDFDVWAVCLVEVHL
jgi:hypothetical protein